MPIEVRELTIKAKIESPENKAPARHAGGTNSKLSDAQINMIVDKIMRLLQERTER